MEYPTWYKQSGFRFTHQEKIVYIDPWEVPEGEPVADFILITHAHFDHFDPSAIERLRKPGTTRGEPGRTIILAPHDVAQELPGDNIVAVRPDETRDVEGLHIKTVPAYNIDKDFHPKENEWVGYIVTINNVRFYHAGDTDHIPEMKNIRTDVAMLPIGGTYTMDMKEAAEAADEIAPQTAVPMHYGVEVGSKEDGERFKKLAKVPVEILTPQIPFKR